MNPKNAAFGVAVLILASVATGLSGLATVAEAHAQLDRAEPGVGSEVRTPVTELVLYFTQGLKQSGSWVQVSDSAGSRLPGEARFDTADPKVMRFTIDLKPDVYTVRWQTLSADDDDYADDSYSFIVLNPDGSQPLDVPGVIGEGETGNSSVSFPAPAVAGAVAIVVIAGIVILIKRRPA